MACAEPLVRTGLCGGDAAAFDTSVDPCRDRALEWIAKSLPPPAGGEPRVFFCIARQRRAKPGTFCVHALGSGAAARGRIAPELAAHGIEGSVRPLTTGLEALEGLGGHRYALIAVALDGGVRTEIGAFTE